MTFFPIRLLVLTISFVCCIIKLLSTVYQPSTQVSHGPTERTVELTSI